MPLFRTICWTLLFILCLRFQPGSSITAILKIICIVLYCTILHCTILYCTILYYTTLYYIILYCFVLCCVGRYFVVWYHIPSTCVGFYCAASLRIVLCRGDKLCRIVFFCSLLSCEVFCHFK